MSFRSRLVLPRLVLPIILSSLAVLAGCGSSTNHVVPPPSGAFDNTDLNGTYTFSVAGEDVNGPMSIAGSFTACGCTGGTISTGTVDFFDPALGAPASAVGSNSTYSVGADGRGTANLYITPSGGTPFKVIFQFVLTSSSHGLIIRYDTTGTGSGTIDLQPSVVAQSAIANAPYAFTLSGSDPGDDLLSTVGTFTLGSSGTITTGVEDCNFNGTPTLPAPTPSGSVLVGSGTTPGSASILTACSSTPLTFDVYTIDSTHLKLIESDGLAFLVGDAFVQTSASIPQGTLVFTMEGLDGGTSGNLFVTGGTVTSDGASELSAGLQDVNDAGTVDGGGTTPASFTGSFVASPSGSGRFLVSLAGFLGASTFAAYPSSGGILMLQIDTELAAGTTSGMALQQTSGAAIAATQGYGLNNSGEDVINDVELDAIAQFTTTSTGMTGLLNLNDGLTITTQNVNGTYTAADSNGAGSATIGTGLQSMFYYAADSSTVLFISTDPNQAALGLFEAQTAPGDAAQSATAKPRPLPMLRALPHSRSATHNSQWLLRNSKLQ